MLRLKLRNTTDTEFIKLPFRFDVTQLQQEVSKFKSSDWLPHPQQYAGNYAIPLISVNGESNDLFKGSMAVTPALQQSPYLQQVIASFEEVFGRSRLMRLDGHSNIPKHADINYHWYNRVRIHIPIITNPDVTFYCGDKQQTMAAGECWLLDTWQPHWVENNADDTRVHLVIDTAGSARFWHMVEQCAEQQRTKQVAQPSHIPYQPQKPITIHTERVNATVVMTPGEIDGMVIDLINDTLNNKDNDKQQTEQFIQVMNNFRFEWRKIWSISGSDPTGYDYYYKILNSVSLPDFPLHLASNKQPCMRTFQVRVLDAVLNI